MMTSPLGPHVHAFFVDYLATQKGLRLTSIRSYRDTLRLFLAFVARDARRALTRLTLSDLTFDRVLRFLTHLEQDRHNGPPTRNQRLAGLHTFFGYLASRVPEMLEGCQRVAAIPTKRAAPPETRYLERDEITTLFARLPTRGRRAFTARELGRLLVHEGTSEVPQAPVFIAHARRPLTRFGIYKLVRRHAGVLDARAAGSQTRRVTPHVFRHTTAVHLLEAGVEVNVIRGWLGHAAVTTTNRYAEITVRSKEAAVRACEAPAEFSVGLSRTPVWRNDPALLAWLASL